MNPEYIPNDFVVTKILENCDFQTQIPSSQVHHYDAGMVLELHPTISAKLVAAGYASLDTSVEANPKTTSNSSYNTVVFTAAERATLDTAEGGALKRISPLYPLRVLGSKQFMPGQIMWADAAGADQAVANEWAVEVRWPDSMDWHADVPEVYGNEAKEVI